MINKMSEIVGKSINEYNKKLKPKIDELKFKEQYQGRIIDCMVGEIDDNYIETPETDAPIVKLEHSKEGIVKVPSIKGKTILVDSDGNETDTPAEGCKLVSVGEDEDNKLIILSKNSDSSLHHKTEILLNEPLRSLSNEIYDEIVGNKIIRRVGSVIVDGSKDFRTQSLNTNNQVLSDYSVDPKSKHLGTQKGIMKYPFGMGNKCTKVLKLTMDRVEGYEPTTHTQAREMFKKHFTENPTEVLYELEEPIIEELPNGIALQGFDDTTMYIENTITPTVQYGYNALIPYKEELRTQKKEVETNTLDIENNIIPYLMDMEFNLMLMEDNE